MTDDVADTLAGAQSAEPADSEDRSRHLPLVLAIAGCVVVLDQFTKWWALESLEPGDPIEIIWTLQFNLVTNTGAAFSTGPDLGPWIGVAALGVVGLLLWTGRSVSTRTGVVGLGLVLGGASGNLLDRALRSGDGVLGGAVIDFIDFQWWPIFNVADMGVVIGAVLLVVGGLLEDRRVARTA